MDREQKAAVVEEIAAEIEDSATIFAIDYRGISVPQAAELRAELRKADASFRIVKNRLTRLAAEKAGRKELDELLEGPTALTFVKGDTAMAAKAISTFNRQHDVLVFKGGFMEELTLDAEKFGAIARLPAREVLDGQLAGIVASPLTGLVLGLGSMISGLAVALQQIAEQGLVSGEAPPAEDSSSLQAAGEEPDPTPPAEETSEDPEEAPEASTEPETPEPEAAEQDASDPDTPGGEAEEVSGGDSEPGADQSSEQAETSNEEE
ncbi:MAG: 50S ribosomal protein L10 [Solirubrobacterales bacterium]